MADMFPDAYIETTLRKEIRERLQEISHDLAPTCWCSTCTEVKWIIRRYEARNNGQG